MYSSSEIRTIHLEMTSKCNASCPMCLRTVLGGKVNPHLPLTELTLAEIKTIFPPHFVRQLNRVYMCGNYGDPIMAKDSLEVFEYLREQNPQIRLEIFTNGSARPGSWWTQLAKVVDECRFAIDGLEDTNHIYRRGTKWPVLSNNIQAYIEAGGKASWDFIVFRHNEHQIETARELSRKWGFKSFQIKKTGRFFSNTKAKVKDRQEVLGPDGEIEYFIELPKDPQYINAALANEEKIESKHGSLKSYLETSCISCKVIPERSAYVTAQGMVFPCCWTANQLYPWYFKPKSGQMWDLVNQLPEGLDSLDARKWKIESIIDGPFFQEFLPASWNKSTYAEGKLFVCAKACGQRDFDPFASQFS